MKEKLIEILGLDAKATDEQVVEAVQGLLDKDKAKAITEGRERAIQKKIAESGGALNRENAIIALDHQDEATKQKGSKPQRK